MGDLGVAAVTFFMLGADATITLSATDAHSGVAHTFYAVNGGAVDPMGYL